MTALNGWEAAVEQLQSLWYLMVPLAAGFGVQVTLFTKLRTIHRHHNSQMVAAGGTSAGVGMLACCAHHVTDVLPIIGLSAASSLLVAYQKPILVASLFVNGIGIIVLWKKVRA